MEGLRINDFDMFSPPIVKWSRGHTRTHTHKMTTKTMMMMTTTTIHPLFIQCTRCHLSRSLYAFGAHFIWAMVLCCYTLRMCTCACARRRLMKWEAYVHMHSNSEIGFSFRIVFEFELCLCNPTLDLTSQILFNFFFRSWSSSSSSSSSFCSSYFHVHTIFTLFHKQAHSNSNNRNSENNIQLEMCASAWMASVVKLMLPVVWVWCCQLPEAHITWGRFLSNAKQTEMNSLPSFQSPTHAHVHTAAAAITTSSAHLHTQWIGMHARRQLVLPNHLNCTSSSNNGITAYRLGLMHALAHSE